MSLDLGVCVVQYLSSGHRYGVIYKKKMDDPSGWAFFEVLWTSGERSSERADSLKTCKSIEEQFTDLNVLKDLQRGVLKFHSEHNIYV